MIHKRKPEDFTVDPKWFELEHPKLEQLLQELSELKEEIEKRNFPFSTKSFGECIFSINPDEFSSISEDMRMLEDRIREMNKRFYYIKNLFVDFVENKIDSCNTFVSSVHSNNYDDRSDGENDFNDDESAKKLETFFNQIKHI